MKLSIKTFESFNYKALDSFFSLNEGNFDKLKNLVSKFIPLFKDPIKIKKAVESILTEMGSNGGTFNAKNYKVGETTMIMMGDGKNPDGDFATAFTKLADLPDGSTLFQISGTTSVEMLKALTGTNKQEDLSNLTVLAIISQNGLDKDKQVSMKLLRNMMPGGKDYLTSSLFLGSVPSVHVEKTLTKLK